jgi:hypothetical protein
VWVLNVLVAQLDLRRSAAKAEDAHQQRVENQRDSPHLVISPSTQLLIVQNGLSRLPLNDQLLAKAVVCQAVPGSVVSSEAPHRPTGIAAAHLSAFNGRPYEYHSGSSRSQA